MLGKVSVAVKNFGVSYFYRLAVTDWRMRCWRLCFLALMTATRNVEQNTYRNDLFYILVAQLI